MTHRPVMLEPKTAIAFAPRGPGLLFALFYVEDGPDVFGWFTGCVGVEFLMRFFVLEGYHSATQTRFYLSSANDVYGRWQWLVRHGAGADVAAPSALGAGMQHELERIKDDFVQAWLFFPGDPHAPENERAYAARELSVQGVNLRADKLNRLRIGPALWTYASPDCDRNIVDWLGKHWPLDYRVED